MADSKGNTWEGDRWRAAAIRELSGFPHMGEDDSRDAIRGSTLLWFHRIAERMDGRLCDVLNPAESSECEWRLPKSDQEAIFRKLAEVIAIVDGAKLERNTLAGARADVALQTLIDQARRGVKPYGPRDLTVKKSKARRPAA